MPWFGFIIATSMSPEAFAIEWPKIEPLLRVGDVIMTRRRKGTIVEKGIQSLSGSYWSHTALVFATGNMLPLGGTIIVETAHPEGMKLHNIKKYTDFPEKFDVGVLRSPGLTDEGRSNLVRSFMASNIDVPYDLTSVFDSGIKLFMVKYMGMKHWAPHTDPDRFVCSTFVHRAIHLGTNKEHHPDTHGFTPGDLANSGDLEWIFNKRA